MNDIIRRAIKRAQVPAVKEPISLTLEDNKRPDGTTLFSPWLKGNHWLEMSQSQTPMQSHIADSVHPRGGSSSSGTTQDYNTKYSKLTSIHNSYPIFFLVSAAD